MTAPLTITTTHACNIVVTSSFECETQTTGGGSTGSAWDAPSMGSYRIYWADAAAGTSGLSPQMTMAGARTRYSIEWQFPADAGRTLTIDLTMSCGLGYKLIARNIEFQVEVIKR